MSESETPAKKRKFHPAWLVLLGVIFIRGFSNGGISMASGLFLAPVSEELGIGIGTLSLYFSISSLAMVVFLPWAGKLLQHWDVRLLAIGGAALQGLSFAAFGLLRHVWGWYLLCIPQAMGAAITVSLLGPILIGRWFSGGVGTPIGIMLSCGNLLGAALQPLASGLIDQRGWRAAYMAMGLLVFLAAVIASLLFLRNSPQSLGLSPYQARTRPRRDTADLVDIPERTAVRTPSFFLLLLFIVAITGVSVFSQYIAAYGTVLGYPLRQTGIALSLFSLGSAAGAVLLGYISDRIGSLKTCYGLIGVGALSVLGFLWGSPYPVYAVSAFLYGAMVSGIAALSPALTLAFFGKTDYEKIYAKVSTGAPLAAILLMPAYGFLYDATGSYILVLIFLLVLLALAVPCILVGWRRRCTSQGCPAWRKQ